MGIKCPKCQTDNPDTQKFCGECATPLPSSKEIPVSPTKTIETPTEELTTGSTFAGRYQIIEELGKGGMGKVYRALDKKLNEEVALKLIKSEIASDKKTLERFGNELKIARKIVHKNIGRMYELMEEKGTHYITMEYVPGQDLKGLIRQSRQLTVGTTISIAKQVCEGLSEAHKLGTVHRDLKPSNIMIDKEGNARIMDFGIARSLKAKGITGAGVMIGTPEYMSPEQVEGKETDQRSDIYSLGIILYEMLTGRVPFEGDTPLSVAVKQKTETPPAPRKLNAQIPEDLSRVILRCMEKDKTNRYQSVREVRSELNMIEKGIPTTERVVPKRKPLTSKEITVTFGLKKLFIPALVVVALVITAVIIWQILPQKEAVPIPTGKPSLAIMYFKNNTGDESFDIWRSALSDSIITDLSQSKFIRVLSGDRLYSILRKLNLLEAKSYASENLKEVAIEGGVNHIFQGSLSKAGDTFRIDYTLQEISTGITIGSDRVEGRGIESVFSMVDELTRRIKASFKLSEEEIAADIDREVGKITTSSPEAYKYYSEGRKFYRWGDFDQCIQLMKRAVAIDPEFAMAYRSMAMSYWNIGYYSEQRMYRRKAMDFTNRLSDREKFLVQAEYYRISGRTYDKAIDAYKKLLQLYPEDWVGNNYLGNLYMFIEEWEKAIESFEVNIQNKVEAFHSYVNISKVYMSKGLYDRAQEVLENYLKNISDNYFIRSLLALNYFSQGKYDFALTEVEKAFLLKPTVIRFPWLRGGIYQFKGDLINAEKEYLKLLELEEKTNHLEGIKALVTLYMQEGKFEKSRDFAKRGIELARKLGQKWWEASFHGSLAYSYLITRNPEAALEEYNKMWKITVEEDLLDYQRRALYGKGLAYLGIKSFDKAQRVADELKDLIEKGVYKKIIRRYYHLKGTIEFEKVNFTKAVEYFKRAIALLPSEGYFGFDTALFIEPLALAYYNTGDIEKACEEYEKITNLTTGRLYCGDIYAKSFYMLAKIYEQQGQKAKAIEHYEKFLDLWKDADPGIAELEDARKRLAGLKKRNNR